MRLAGAPLPPRRLVGERLVMRGKRKKKSVQLPPQPTGTPVAPPPPLIHEATLVSSGAVRKGNVITQAEAMLFFTPELYLRYNSQDDKMALAADAEWELAIVRYHQYLATVREKMPSAVDELSRLCLHDGDILQRQEQLGPLSSGCFEGWPGPPPFFPFWYRLATRKRLPSICIVIIVLSHDSGRRATSCCVR